MIGSSLGPYEVTAKLGEGNMGELDRAADSKLGRGRVDLPFALGGNEKGRQR